MTPDGLGNIGEAPNRSADEARFLTEYFFEPRRSSADSFYPFAEALPADFTCPPAPIKSKRPDNFELMTR
jgi:hypothetical protein